MLNNTYKASPFIAKIKVKIEAIPSVICYHYLKLCRQIYTLIS